MAFLNGQLFLEFAIRIGTDDLMKRPEMLDWIFKANPHINEGVVISADGEPIEREKEINDYFYQRLSEIPRTNAEITLPSIFRNNFTQTPDVAEYLRTANISIKHQFPRDSADLPCISIILGNEAEEQYIGHSLGKAQVAGTQYELLGVNQDVVYNLMILSTNENELTIWGNIIKYSLLKYRRELEGLGLKKARVSMGDPEPAAEYLQSGHFVYQRSITFQCEKLDYFPVEDHGFDSVEWTNPNEAKP